MAAKEGHTWTPEKTRYCVKRAVIALLIIIIWGLFALPTAMYFLPQNTTQEDEVSMSQANASSCHTTELYNGTICRDVLWLFRQYLPNSDLSQSGRDIYIPLNDNMNQQQLEEQACHIIAYLSEFSSTNSECGKVGKQFMCLLIFGLCGNSGELYLPSYGACRMVTEEICGGDFRRVLHEDPELDSLPQCRELPDTVFEKYTGDFGNETGSINISKVDMNFTNEIECSKDFYLDAESGLCRPECGEWEEFPHSTVLAIDVVIILQAVVFFISATVFLLMSCIHYRRMFRFPSIFIIYGTISVGVFELFLLIGYIDRKVLFCSSCDIIESIENTAIFCTIQGLIVNYIVLVIPIFSLFHIAVVAWAINFPFQAQAFKKKGHFKYVHIVMISVALILPFGSVAAAFSDGGYGILRFPPIICYPQSIKVILYGMILPVSVMIASEISLLVIIFWVVIKFVCKQRNQNHNAMGLKAAMKAQLHMNTAELKVIIIFIYYAVSGGSLLAITAVISRVPLFTGELIRYSMCEAGGANSGPVCERPFERLSTEIAVDAYLVLQGLYPLINLVYVVNIQELKLWFARQHKGSRSTGTSR